MASTASQQEETVDQPADLTSQSKSLLDAINQLDDAGSSADSTSSTFSIRQWIATRTFRTGLVSSILLLWTVFILPFDLWGARNHWESLHIWLAAHLSVCIASVIALSLSISCCFEFIQNWKRSLQIIVVLLTLAGAVLQIFGAVVYSYQYCSYVALNDDPLWTACISDSYGIYLIFDSGLVFYLGVVIFAERFHGIIPLIDITFGKTFRVLYVSLVALIGMVLVALYGFMVYNELDDDDQVSIPQMISSFNNLCRFLRHAAIYIGYTFMGTASVIIVVDQLLFHCPCTEQLFVDRAQVYPAPQRSLSIQDLEESGAVEVELKPMTEDQRSCITNLETFLYIICHFLIYAGLVVILMYSLFSKIPKAALIEDMLRMIGQNVLIAGIGVLMSYELFARNDDYSENGLSGDFGEEEDYPYHAIPDQGL